MNKIEKLVWDLAAPLAEAQGVELWDVEYVLEAGQRYLRVYIDSPDGVDIEMCERYSRALDPILDEADPVPDSYIFEVSSAGAERALKRPGDFRRFLGSTVELKLYKGINGSRQRIGCLEAYDDDGTVTVSGEAFAAKDVASVRLHIDFDSEGLK